MHCTAWEKKEGEKKLLHTAAPEILFQLLLCILFEDRAWQLHLWSVSIRWNISADISLRPDCLTRTWKPRLKEVITHLGRERQTPTRTHTNTRRALPRAHTHMLTLKIEAAIPLTLVNVPHPRQLDLHIFNVLFFLSASSLWFRLFFTLSPHPSSPFLSCGCRLSWRLARKKEGLLSVLRGKLFVSNREKEKRVGEIFSNCRN